MSHRGRAITPLLAAVAISWLWLASAVAAAPLYPNQSLGNRGVDVKALQGLLMERGAAIRVDGIFGATTAAAVRYFQTAKGLPVTGQADERTWVALVVRVESGSTGQAVKALQRQLNEKRRAGLVVDGVFGATTRSRIADVPAARAPGRDRDRRPADLALPDQRTSSGRCSAARLCDYQVGNGLGELGHGRGDRPDRAAAVDVVAKGHGRDRGRRHRLRARRRHPRPRHPRARPRRRHPADARRTSEQCSCGGRTTALDLRPGGDAGADQGDPGERARATSS